MSRSFKKVSAWYMCSGAKPATGKKVTSRKLRRKVNLLLNKDGEDFDFAHPQDKIRGAAGSREDDYGWTWFGDGRNRVFKMKIRDNDNDAIVAWKLKGFRK